VTPLSAVRVFLAVVVRPRLWVTALRQAARLAAPGWWRRRPFLPVPANDYAAMRSTIQYGGQHHRIDVADVLKYLAWCKAEGAQA